MTGLESTATLLNLARRYLPGGQVSALGLECLCLIAEQPRTVEQLELLTGAHNATITRQLMRLCVHYNRRTKEVMKPDVVLLQRRSRPRDKGYRYHLHSNGRKLLASAGLLAPVSSDNHQTTESPCM